MQNQDRASVHRPESGSTLPTPRCGLLLRGTCALIAAPLAITTLIMLLAPRAANAQSPAELAGAWAADEYWMAEGGVHEVQGRIFFTDRDWQVLFFVMDDSGEARRGSGEGGTYTVAGGELTFTHLFNLSVGEEMVGLPAADLQIVSRLPEGAPIEPTNIEIDGDVLTLHFPSGNRMTFLRR